MKKVIFLAMMLVSVMLSGCPVNILPAGTYIPPSQPVYPAFYPAYYGTVYYNRPIDYSRPHGVWYPWGNMNGSDGHHKKGGGRDGRRDGRR